MPTITININATFKKNLLIIVLFIAFVFFFSIHGGKQPFPELIHRISYDIVEILNKNGIPVMHDRSTQWFASSAVPGKYTIYYFQADEIPFAVKMETIKYFMDLYEERGRSERFRLKMYRETKAERQRLFSGVKPFFEMTIGGNN